MVAPTADLASGPNHEARWETVSDGLSRFAGRDLAIDDETYVSASGTDHRNRAIAQLLDSLGALRHEPVESLDLYTRQSCRYALTVMTTAGLYETSGDWLYQVGLPGKSDIGGGIVTVSPRKGGLGTFSLPLDDAGNSVRGQRPAAYLSSRLGLDIFASTAQDRDS